MDVKEFIYLSHTIKRFQFTERVVAEALVLHKVGTIVMLKTNLKLQKYFRDQASVWSAYSMLSIYELVDHR